MELVSNFTDQADDTGIFIAQINLGDLLSYRGQYTKFLRSAAHDLGIQIGVNGTELGLELGFEKFEHYEATMRLVEPKLQGIIDTLNRSITRYSDPEPPPTKGIDDHPDIERNEDFGALYR